MKSSILSIEEERVNFIAFIFGVLASGGSFIVVVGFLDGTPRDAISLGLVGICLLIRFLEKHLSRFKKYAKYAYMTGPFWVTCAMVISNDGKYAAVTQAYFMWLILSIAYYEVVLVLFCSAVTIFSTVGAIVLFPEAMLQLDNMTIWLYIFMIYFMATILAAIIARRMRILIEQTREMKRYEDELSYLEQLEEKEERHGEFIHNINHYFKAIGELAREEHCDQIINLMKELNLNLMQNERTIYTSHRVVNAVLSEKAREASGNGIDFDVYVEPGIRFGMTADSDLVAMLGNLLDNAFEAAKSCSDDKRKAMLRIYMEKEGRMCVVKLVNFFAEKPQRKKSGFISTKWEKGLHGIGIKSVENTVRKYNGYLQCFIDEERFTAVLVLPVEK
ncbi:MAG: GHKL domain-containing protein [Lachnospiraceae bacterium]|nr:GHKL domain-containing protein [Lachnospiraceae bacterium]